MSNIKKRNQLIKMLMDRGGFTKNQAIGLVANFEAESSLNSVAHNPNDPGGSHGLAQWNRGRLDKLKKMYPGDEWTKVENQIDYVIWELNNTHKSVGEKLRKATTFEEATSLITTEYEVPANRHQRAKERIKIAKGYTDIIPEDYDYSVWENSSKVGGSRIDSNPVEYIKERVAIGDPQFNYQTNMGIISSAPDMSEEDKSEISKISIIQKQLEDLQKQMSEQPQVAQSPEPTPQVQQQTSQRPSRASYLSNTDLFTIQGGLPEF